MGSRETFGPDLKRIRIRRGLSLARIAEATNVGEELWAAMERNDFSRWPAGIYARAYLRTYASMIDVDPDLVVDEFCRWFPHGDRRADRIIREQASIVNHPLEYREDGVGASRDREIEGRRFEDQVRARNKWWAADWVQPAVRAWQWVAKLTDAAGGSRRNVEGRGRDVRPAGEDGAARGPSQAHLTR